MIPFASLRRRRRGPGVGAADPPAGVIPAPVPAAGASPQVTAEAARSIAVGRDVSGSALGPGSSVTNNYGPRPEPPPDEDEIERELARYAARVRASHGRLDLEVLIPSQAGEHPAVELQSVFVPPELRADPPPVELPRELRQRLEGRADELPWGEFPPGLDEESMERVRLAYRDRPPVEASVRNPLFQAVSDPNREPRWLALQLLARYWPEREDVQRLILDLMTADPSAGNRRNALNWCAWLRDAEPDTHETIRSVALSDPAPGVRVSALRVLAFGWPRLSATTRFLRERAGEDPDERVREAAALALGTAEAFAALPDGTY